MKSNLNKALYSIYMGKSNKITYVDNIGMSNYEKALRYYGLTGKNERQVSANINYQPKMKVKVKGKPERLVNVTDTNSDRYKDKVRTELINRWKYDTKVIIGQYALTFRKYNKNTGRYSKGSIPFSVVGSRADQEILARKEFEAKLEEYQDGYESSKDWVVLDYVKTGQMEVGEKTGSGVDNGKTITTTKGGQRKVGMKGHKAIIRMKNRFALKFSDTDDEWDRGVGTCVFDYIYENYRCKEFDGTKRKPKSRDEAYLWLNELLKIDETENPLKDGVSVYQLESFCNEFNCSMYVYDETDDLIEYYKPNKVREDIKPLMFRVFDGHFSPVPNDKRKSIASRSSKTNITPFKSNEMEYYNNKITKSTKDKPLQIIAPTQDEYDAIKEELERNNYPISVSNRIAMDYIKKNNMEIPFPLDCNSLVVEENSITKIRYNDKIVLTKPIDPLIKSWYENNNEDYNGEGITNILDRIWIDKYGFRLALAPFMSKMNTEVSNALSVSKVKWRTHIGLIPINDYYYSNDEIKELLIQDKAVAVDIAKCYCDGLYNPRERWIVFNGKEQVEEYDRKPLTLGLYFIVTDDMTLFHRSNWYSKQIIKKALEEGIKFKITHQIRCVDTIWEYQQQDEEQDLVKWKLDNKNLFKDIIDEIVELTEQDEDFTITKLAINAISGYLGRTHRKKKSASLNTKLSDIWENWIVGDSEYVVEKGEDIYISEYKDGDTTMYLYGVETKEENLTNGLPMYIQLLDSSNIALYDMMKAVGGTCIYRKTDMIVSIGGNIPTTKVASNYQETFGTYRNDKVHALNYNYIVKMNTHRAVETPRLSQEWEYWDFNDSTDWERILNTAISKGGMLISGRAGTGKSYIIKKGIEAGLLSSNRETRMSFTNRAARNIDGTTIHKNMAININGKTNSKTLQSLKKYNIFIVDEISMINSDLWNKLCLLKKSTGSTFILLGDYRQCPPIEDGSEVDYFNHPYTKYLANYNCCELTIPQRYNMDLWNWLEDFYENGRINDTIKFDIPTLDSLLESKNIVYYNKTRTNINSICMNEKIKTKDYMVLNVPEKCSNDKAQLTYIYVGLPIMSIVNNKELEIVNSDEFVVTDFNSNSITMVAEYGDLLTIEPKEFHKLFVVNYASTTHKNQGATVNIDINIFDWDMMISDRKLGYTAVSRATSCEQITIVENYKSYYTKSD